MAKELVISTGRHETRVAILEDDQLVEIYFQRANEYSLAGSIHKGRVTRVLPGMQSAFVDLGLERDTFLYVSDFFEENEEFEKMPEGRERNDRDRGGRSREGNREAGARETANREAAPREGGGRESGGRDGGRGRGRDRREGRPPVQTSAIEVPIETGEAPVAAPVAAGESAEGGEVRRGNRRRRGRGNRGGNFPDSKYAGPNEEQEIVAAAVEPEVEVEEEEVEVVEEFSAPILLPGETLSKYRGRAPELVAAVVEEDRSGDFDDVDEVSSVAAETQEEEATGTITPLKPATQEVLAAQLEEEVLEEVKEHLAEIAKENEEQRDFEEAERLVYEDQEATASASELEAQDAQDAADSDEDDESEDGAIDESSEAANDLTTEETATDSADMVDGDEEGALPSMGYSAHLRQNDQRFLQQRAPQEGGERSGRRRRRGRGRDRADRAAASAAPTGEAVPELLIEAGELRPPESAAVVRTDQSARTEQTPREESRREGRGRRERGGERNGERGERSERTSETSERTERPERGERRPQPSITELLKEGQEILVQIAKEPLGQKGARITSHIALPGRYCVYMPTVDHTGVSRKIASDEERMRLKKILQAGKEGMPGGFIIRTAGEGRTEEEIQNDINFLHNLWNDIKRKAESKPAPALIYHDLEIVERVLRDQLGPDFKSIWVDNEEIYESILRFLERFQPAMVSRVKMYTRQASIFDNFGITQELEKALRPKVWLKSGGYIVINQTEALVAIDINTGKFVGKSNRLEDTIVKTNIEAIREIVRQVRLRDLGGIIVIDFIDMDERKNRMRVMQALEEAMRADRAPYKILQFNDFGLVAITRKRVKQSLERTLCAPCPYCEGSAYVKSVQTVVGEILNEAKKLAKALADAKDVMLRVNPEVAKVFKSADNQYLEELEEIVGRPVMVVSDGLIHQEKFDLA
ncbi:Rne/Rng family ribonuclease [Bryobacter aggregatus]|uniref:Rne/Rng family ribonuclease n=1 Tax=Bryobacter aggregatus TaxID=360054 RepID=UPI0004E1A37F|nr:Rne/Rng family ribonuclease [Bryobacter aggregatus]